MGFRLILTPQYFSYFFLKMTIFVKKITMSTLAIREQLMEMPNLPKVIREIQTALDIERLKRLAFYEWVEEDMKAEFINGEIIENSPAADEHTDSVMSLGSLAYNFSNFQKSGKVETEKAMVSLTRNDYEPDIAFWRKEMAQNFKNGQTHYPAPDWICEVLSKGTAARDRGIKFEDYAAHGVKEYWIVNPRQKTIEQYVLPEEGDTYELLKKVSIGDSIESVVMKGFRIPVSAVFDEDVNRETLKKKISGVL